MIPSHFATRTAGFPIHPFVPRRLALAVLPDQTVTLVVRVLEAFMALQYQAGVLTEEVVLAVQGLVEVKWCICVPRR